MTRRDDIQRILDSHRRWLERDPRDREARAVLVQEDLSGYDLAGIDLTSAVLTNSALYGANLRNAVLYRAVLCGTSFRAANLRNADLRWAQLNNANLIDADLRGADLRNATLSGANLIGAQLLDAKLPHYQIPQEGDLIGYKKLRDQSICKLLIPAAAKRTASLIGRKCRAEYVIVLAGGGQSDRVQLGNQSVHVQYTEGEYARPDSYNSDPKLECTNGIHFFLTRQEAEEW